MSQCHVRRYVWFDFHHECRKMQWHNLSKLMAIVEADFDAYGFFARDAEGRVTRRQTGVIRTNCMDNLDRTNVVQVRLWCGACWSRSCCGLVQGLITQWFVFLPAEFVCASIHHDRRRQAWRAA